MELLEGVAGGMIIVTQVGADEPRQDQCVGNLDAVGAELWVELGENGEVIGQDIVAHHFVSLHQIV